MRGELCSPSFINLFIHSILHSLIYEGDIKEFVDCLQNLKRLRARQETLGIPKTPIVRPYKKFGYIYVLFFSSLELKAQVSFSNRLSSVVCLSVRTSVRPIFDFSRTTGPILIKLGTMHLW